MTTVERSASNSESKVPIPALLVGRAVDLARAEAGLTLLHTRRIAVGAVSALLGTIVACAFAQLTLVLLVVWPVLSGRVPLVNLLLGVLVSAAFAAAGGIFALLTWTRVARERSATSSSSAQPKPAVDAAESPEAVERGSRRHDTYEPPRTVNLTERVNQ